MTFLYKIEHRCGASANLDEHFFLNPYKKTIPVELNYICSVHRRGFFVEKSFLLVCQSYTILKCFLCIENAYLTINLNVKNGQLAYLPAQNKCKNIKK